MSTGVFCPSRTLLMRLAYFIEGRFADTTDAVAEVGGGVHERRPAFLRVHNHCLIVPHPDGSRHALIVDGAGVPARLAVVIAAINAKAANQRDQDEADILALPAAATLDVTWTGPSTPF